LSEDTVLLFWTAPGDDENTGQALYYDLRYSYDDIANEQDYLTAYRYTTGGSYPAEAGKTDSVYVLISQLEDFSDQTAMYVALRAEDDAMNGGPLGSSRQVGLGCCIGVRGNVDGDLEQNVNITDVTYLLSYLFDGGSVPGCPDEADANADSLINVQDVVHIIAYLFGGGPAPAGCP
jgi:hypothetical protein